MHCLDVSLKYQVSGNVRKDLQFYAQDYGYKQKIESVSYEARDKLKCEIEL